MRQWNKISFHFCATLPASSRTLAPLQMCIRGWRPTLPPWAGGALGGAAMGGAVGMLGGPAGMLAGAGIGAMVGALSGLAIMDWPAITGGLTRIHDGLRNLFMGSDADRAQSWSNLKDKLKGLFAGINDALANFADSAYSNGKQWGLAILNGILRGIDQIIPSVEAAIKNLFTGAGAHAIPSTPGIYGPNDKVPPGHSRSPGEAFEPCASGRASPGELHRQH